MKIKVVVCTLAIALIGAGTVACRTSPFAGKEKISSHFKTVEIRDEVLGMIAFRMQIPDDWTFEGVVLRVHGCDLPPAVAYRASSPDGLVGIQSLPQVGWHWSDDENNLRIYREFHCKTMLPMSATDFMKYMAPMVRPNPTLGEILPTGDADKWNADIEQSNRRSQQAHLQLSETGGAVHSRIEYTFHGQQIEENLAVRMTCTKQQIGAYRGPVHYTWSSVAYINGFRAPKGQLDSVMKAIGPTMAGNYTSEWSQQISQNISRQLAANNAKNMAMIKKQGDDIMATMKRNHEAFMQQQQSSFEHAQQADRDRQDAMHRSAVAYTLYAGDEQLVRNPSTGEVSRVTNQAGKNGWQDQTSNQILMTDSNNLNPNLYLRGNWTQLENVDPMKP